MVNYLARLGWSHGDQEIFSREDLVAALRPRPRRPAAAVFDPAKLEWLSHHWIKAAPPPRLAAELASVPRARRTARARGSRRGSGAWWTRSRSARARWSRWPSRPRSTCAAREQYDPQATAKFWGPEASTRYALADPPPRGAGGHGPGRARRPLPRPRRRPRPQARRPRPAHRASPSPARTVEPADLRGAWRSSAARRRWPGSGRPAAALERPVRRLLLARHGQSLSNAVTTLPGARRTSRCPSSACARPSALGRRARAAAASPRVYASPLERARRTAEIALGGIGAAAHDLRGRSPRAVAGRVGGLHGRGDPRAARRSLRAVGPRSPRCLPPGGEPLADVQDARGRRPSTDRRRASERRRRADRLPTAA